MFGVAARCCSSLLARARSLYLQWFDNEFLQEQGASRYSRGLEVPAHRGRILDRIGEPLAITTPVKSIWAFPDKVDATPDQLAALAAILDLTPPTLTARLDAGDDFVYLQAQSRPKSRSASLALEIKGVHDDERIPPLLPRRRSDERTSSASPAIDDVGQEGIELAQQAWLGGAPGSRRVIINRRGDVVEDVERSARRRRAAIWRLSIDSAPAVPRLPRAQGRGRGEQGEGRRPRHPRRADRRDPGARQLADLQPEQPQPASRASRCATAR